MRKFAFFLILFLIVGSILIIPNLIPAKPIEGIKKFSLKYTNGNEVNSNVLYEIYSGNTYTVTVKLSGETDEEAYRNTMSDDDINTLESILNKYKISKWDGFKGFDKNILDGNSFVLTISTNSLSVHASGYMKYPSNYKKFVKEIDEFFTNLRKKG